AHAGDVLRGGGVPREARYSRRRAAPDRGPERLVRPQPRHERRFAAARDAVPGTDGPLGHGPPLPRGPRYPQGPGAGAGLPVLRSPAAPDRVAVPRRAPCRRSTTALPLNAYARRSPPRDARHLARGAPRADAAGSVRAQGRVTHAIRLP